MLVLGHRGVIESDCACAPDPVWPKRPTRWAVALAVVGTLSACAGPRKGPTAAREGVGPLHLDTLQLTTYRVSAPPHGASGPTAASGSISIWGLPCDTDTCAIELGGDVVVENVPGLSDAGRLVIVMPGKSITGALGTSTWRPSTREPPAVSLANGTRSVDGASVRLSKPSLDPSNRILGFDLTLADGGLPGPVTIHVAAVADHVPPRARAVATAVTRDGIATLQLDGTTSSPRTSPIVRYTWWRRGPDATESKLGEGAQLSVVGSPSDDIELLIEDDHLGASRAHVVVAAAH